MNTKTQKAIVIAVAFFLVGTILNIDYAMWNEETHNEYQRYMQNIIEGNISVAIPVTKEQFEEYAREEGNYTFYYLRVGKSFEEWKHDNGKSYWTDLTKRLRVVAVSADECNNFSLYEVGDEYRGYTDTYMPYLSSYMEFCKFFTQTENIRMLVLDDSYRREYTDVNESQIIGRQFNAGRGVSAVYHTEYGAMLKVSRCGCNNEYKYIQPVFVVHHEDYLEFYKILESVYNISTQIKEPPQDIPTVLEVNITTPDAPILNPCDAYINNSNWKCEYNESTGHIWITAVGWCNNCEGEGCEPEELPEPPKITELGDEWEDVNESIFEMYPIHNSPTIYTMDYPKERKYFNPWWVSQ